MVQFVLTFSFQLRLQTLDRLQTGVGLFVRDFGHVGIQQAVSLSFASGAVLLVSKVSSNATRQPLAYSAHDRRGTREN